MNYEMYLPLYGNYLQIERLASKESQERPFEIQAMDAIATGAVSGGMFGLSTALFPTRGNVLIAQNMVKVVSSSPVVLPVVVAAISTVAVTELYDYAVVSKAPAEEESFWWRVWSSGLTGAGVTQYY